MESAVDQQHHTGADYRRPETASWGQKRIWLPCAFPVPVGFIFVLLTILGGDARGLERYGQEQPAAEI